MRLALGSPWTGWRPQPPCRSRPLDRSFEVPPALAPCTPGRSGSLFTAARQAKAPLGHLGVRQCRLEPYRTQWRFLATRSTLADSMCPMVPERSGWCPSGTFRAQAVCHTQAVADAQWGPGPPKRPQGTPRESGAASPEVLGPARRQAPRLDEMAATAMPAAQIGPHASAHLIGFSAFEGDQCCQWRCAVTGPKVTQSRQTTGICPEGRRTIVLLSIPALCQTLR
jgi:hypothetical protein